MKYICFKFSREGEIYINAEDISAVRPTESKGICTIVLRSGFVYDNIKCDAKLLAKTLVNGSNGLYYFD